MNMDTTGIHRVTVRYPALACSRYSFRFQDSGIGEHDHSPPSRFPVVTVASLQFGHGPARVVAVDFFPPRRSVPLSTVSSHARDEKSRCNLALSRARPFLPMLRVGVLDINRRARGTFLCAGWPMGRSPVARGLEFVSCAHAQEAHARTDELAQLGSCDPPARLGDRCCLYRRTLRNPEQKCGHEQVLSITQLARMRAARPLRGAWRPSSTGPAPARAGHITRYDRPCLKYLPQAVGAFCSDSPLSVPMTSPSLASSLDRHEPDARERRCGPCSVRCSPSRPKAARASHSSRDP